MTLEEYKKIKNEIEDKIAELRKAYQAAREPLEALRDAAYSEAVESAPFKVGDVVAARHSRGYGQNPIEKCQITKVAISDWHKFYYYRGVKTKKDGTFGTQDAPLLDVQPYDERQERR